MGNGRTYRTEWQHAWVRDPISGQSKLSHVWPRRVPVKVTSWRDRVKASGDVLLLAAVLACFVLAAVTK